jgi:NAD(P)H-flavin reductase
MLPARFRVSGRRRETADTWTLALDRVEGGAPLRFEPGQFNMVYAFGVGEIPVSISGDPAAPERLVHTVRSVGAVSEAICRADVGDVLGVRGPFGSIWPLPVARGADVLVVAGGLGLAPLRPLLYRLAADRERIGRALLLYGGREPEQLLFADELESWRSQGIETQVTVDIAASDWSGRVGVVPSLIVRASFEPSRAVAFVCGPEAMMRFSSTALVDRGVDAARIFVSMERNMKCAVGRCGHCQLGPEFVCRDGPVFTYARVEKAFVVREV